MGAFGYRPSQENKAASPSKPRDRIPSLKEIRALKKISDYGNYSPEAIACAVFLFSCETAMRRGEILNLEKSTVNLRKRTATVLGTKNNDDRIVPLTNAAIEIWKAYGPFQIKRYRCSQVFRKICRRAEIENLRLHDARREGTSRLAKKVDVLTLASVFLADFNMTLYFLIMVFVTLFILQGSLTRYYSCVAENHH